MLFPLTHLPMQLSPRQDAALKRADQWLRDWYASNGTGQQTFYLAGFAGSGKSTIAKQLAELCDGTVLFCAYTGKAAHVLEQKGCTGATTIHRLIYHQAGEAPDGKQIALWKEELAGLRQNAGYTLPDGGVNFAKVSESMRRKRDGEPPTLTEQRMAELSSRIERAEADAGRKGPRFRLNEESDVKRAELVIVDECSMVDTRIGRDLESFKKPILVLGDPAQLPPVGGGGYFTGREPDVLLDEVHRQARESGILRLATDIRNGRRIEYGEYGNDCEVLPFGNPRLEDLAMRADQVLVGRNRTRHASNAKLRRLRGLEGNIPCAGDRVICHRNNHELGLLNGSLWTVEKATDLDGQTALLELLSAEDEREIRVSSKAWLHGFQGREDELHFSVKRDCDEFGYGYAITVHKSQGSQWPNVVVFDESSSFGADAWRHLYTAVTRAATQLTLVR